MGAITRAAANNITTGGVILPAGINDASVASITALAQVSAGDGITLISSQTASSSASISFTTGIDSTYRTYMFKFINIHPQTDDKDFGFNMSTDGGSNYNVVKTSASFLARHDESGSTSALEYYANTHSTQSTSYEVIAKASGADSDQAISGTLMLFNPSSTTYVKHYILSLNHILHADACYSHFTGGYGNTTSAINAVDFKMVNGGNIDAGTILMYGIA
jgi:hypothetical protein